MSLRVTKAHIANSGETSLMMIIKMIHLSAFKGYAQGQTHLGSQTTSK